MSDYSPEQLARLAAVKDASNRPQSGQRFFCPSQHCTYVGPHNKLAEEGNKSTWQCPVCMTITTLERYDKSKWQGIIDRAAGPQVS